jgi:hypothetical protein
MSSSDRSRMSRVRFPALWIALASVLVLAPGAAAKVWFQHMQGREVHRGQRVATTILGCRGNPSCRDAVEGITVQMRRAVKTWRSPHARTWRLGRVDRNGRLVFRVPPVATGRYQLIAYQRIAGNRRLLRVSGSFRVVARTR